MVPKTEDTLDVSTLDAPNTLSGSPPQGDHSWQQNLLYTAVNGLSPTV